jgi:isohexenylglutaconyl-CoA hydratase
VFCAGGDLKGFKNNFQAVRTDEEVVEDSSKMGRFFLTVKSMPQVIIFVLHGAAMAGGLGMAAAGDIVIGVKDTKMALTETAIGIVPAQIGRYIVARTGDIKARRIMLTGHRFTAAEGADYGLVDIAVADMKAAEAQLAELIAGVRRCAPGANAATKELLVANAQLGDTEMIRYAGEAFAKSVKSDEGKEGVASFLEKRKPNWVQG